MVSFVYIQTTKSFIELSLWRFHSYTSCLLFFHPFRRMMRTTRAKGGKTLSLDTAQVWHTLICGHETCSNALLGQRQWGERSRYCLGNYIPQRSIYSVETYSH